MSGLLDLAQSPRLQNVPVEKNVNCPREFIEQPRPFDNHVTSCCPGMYNPSPVDTRLRMPVPCRGECRLEKASHRRLGKQVVSLMEHECRTEMLKQNRHGFAELCVVYQRDCRISNTVRQTNGDFRPPPRLRPDYSLPSKISPNLPEIGKARVLLPIAVGKEQPQSEGGRPSVRAEKKRFSMTQ